ncbi:MAG: hypothetical protein V9G98_27120 [Candidatus Competibacter sp.]
MTTCAFLQTQQHAVPRGVRVRPQRQPQVGIVGNQAAGGAGGIDRVQSRATRRLADQTDRAKMQ